MTVSLLEDKGYDPLCYRFFCLQSHYRKGLVFSWENLDNAAQAYQKLVARIAALDPKDGAVDQAVVEQYKEKFLQQVGNDLNTSMAVTPAVRRPEGQGQRGHQAGHPGQLRPGAVPVPAGQGGRRPGRSRPR